MGTSQSSEGPPSGVPMVPPWVADPPSDDVPANSEPPLQGEAEIAQPNAPVLAPAARFGSARRALGQFAESGDPGRLRQGVGRYVGTGLGGSATAVKRLAGTARAASTLYSLLGGGGQGPSAPPPLDRDAFAGRSADETVRAIVEAVRPVDGTDDAEVTRNSANDALTDLLDRYPDADLFDLTEDQREYVLQRFVSMDVYRRFVLDVGKHIQDNAPSATVGLARLRQAREYIRETVVASFRRLEIAQQRLSTSSVVQLVRRVLQDAFDVFSEYAE